RKSARQGRRTIALAPSEPAARSTTDSGARRGPEHAVEHPVVDLVDDPFPVAEASASVDARAEAALLHLAADVVLVDGDIPAAIVGLDDIVEVRPRGGGPRKARAVDQGRAVRTVRMQLQIPERVDRGGDVGAGEDEGRERAVACLALERRDHREAPVA